MRGERGGGGGEEKTENILNCFWARRNDERNDGRNEGRKKSAYIARSELSLSSPIVLVLPPLLPLLTSSSILPIPDFTADLDFSITDVDGSQVGSGVLKLPDISSVAGAEGEFEVQQEWKKGRNSRAVVEECGRLEEEVKKALVGFVKKFNAQY